MDKFAEQLFGRPDKSRDKDGPGLMEGIAKTFVKSAASRAMGAASGQRGRGGGFDHEDFRALGGFVLEMLNGDEAERLRKKQKKRRHSERETDRDMARDGGQDAGFGDGTEKRKRRRGHKLSGSPLHVTFAEPLQDYDYPPVRKRHRRRREEIPEPEPEPRRSSRHHRRRRSHEDRRSRRRHHDRHRIDLRSLRTELEGMSSTIIGLNARSASHRDCDFYDKFVRKGSRLQEAIGSTLGQIRELDLPDEDEERRERKRRRRERERERERERRW
ncbi:hypothetical protein EDB81DRAFT_65842 [Dactylonectria macrodidyma]|uniref:Uncharacterized protein n=1 Tax=Dactylonectria macrodidyma TaxID=307937 RepID=A0A9P9EPB0_9HYPO|nr:hypothetical protein EDB81DRAFT_65842 [Dactylonectria macrodidyma]